jgi:hypothetical protein
VNDILKPQASQQLQLLGCKSATDTKKLHAWNMLANSGEDLEQHIEALARYSASDTQQPDVLSGISRKVGRQFGINQRIWYRRAGRVNSIVDHTYPLRRHNPVPQQLVTSSCANGDNMRRLPESVQNSRGHYAEPAGTLLGFGIEQATEGGQIVTGDRSTLWRKTVDKLGVAVIHDVEKIELSHPMPQPTGIIDEAADQSIGILEQQPTSKHRQASESSMQARAQALHNKISGVAPFEVFEEHVGN